MLLFLRETPAPPAPATARKLGRELLRSLLSRDYRVAALICVLFYAVPSFTDPFYYYQTDTLGLSSQTIGWFKFINCLGGIVGAIAYAAFCRRFGLRLLLPAGILAYAACMLLYLGYHSMRAGIVIEGLAGFLIALSALPFYQLSTRVSPARSGAFAFAVLVGISKAVGGLSRLLGAQLQVWFDLDLRALIWISALSVRDFQDWRPPASFIRCQCCSLAYGLGCVCWDADSRAAHVVGEFTRIPTGDNRRRFREWKVAEGEMCRLLGAEDARQRLAANVFRAVTLADHAPPV